MPLRANTQFGWGLFIGGIAVLFRRLPDRIDKIAGGIASQSCIESEHTDTGNPMFDKAKLRASDLHMNDADSSNGRGLTAAKPAEGTSLQEDTI